MKRPDQLTRRELIELVERIRDWLYLSEDTFDDIASMHGTAFARRVQKGGKLHGAYYEHFNPDKSWDSDTLDGVAEMLQDFNLVPTKPMTLGQVYRKPTPNQNWRNDAIQFPRLISEMFAALHFNILEQKALCDSMDLAWTDILMIVHRADKEWNRIKKEMVE